MKETQSLPLMANRQTRGLLAHSDVQIRSRQGQLITASEELFRNFGIALNDTHRKWIRAAQENGSVYAYRILMVIQDKVIAFFRSQESVDLVLNGPDSDMVIDLDTLQTRERLGFQKKWQSGQYLFRWSPESIADCLRECGKSTHVDMSEEFKKTVSGMPFFWVFKPDFDDGGLMVRESSLLHVDLFSNVNMVGDVKGLDAHYFNIHNLWIRSVIDTMEPSLYVRGDVVNSISSLGHARFFDFVLLHVRNNTSATPWMDRDEWRKLLELSPSCPPSKWRYALDNVRSRTLPVICKKLNLKSLRFETNSKRGDAFLGRLCYEIDERLPPVFASEDQTRLLHRSDRLKGQPAPPARAVRIGEEFLLDNKPRDRICLTKERLLNNREAQQILIDAIMILDLDQATARRGLLDYIASSRNCKSLSLARWRGFAVKWVERRIDNYRLCGTPPPVTPSLFDEPEPRALVPKPRKVTGKPRGRPKASTAFQPEMITGKELDEVVAVILEKPALQLEPEDALAYARWFVLAFRDYHGSTEYTPSRWRSMFKGYVRNGCAMTKNINTHFGHHFSPKMLTETTDFQTFYHRNQTLQWEIDFCLDHFAEHNEQRKLPIRAWRREAWKWLMNEQQLVQDGVTFPDTLPND